MNRFIIFLFFCALIGTSYEVTQGVFWSDFLCVPLFLYALFFIRKLDFKKNIVAKSSIVYSLILLLTGLLNETCTDTIFLNFTRIFVEGTVAYTSLVIALRCNKELVFFRCLFYIFSVYFLIFSAISLTSSIELEGNFQALDIQSGRNGMAISNLLLVIMLSFLIILSKYSKEKVLYVLFPFFIFNIFFSASRFSVISLGLFSLFIMYWLRKKISAKGACLVLVFVAILFYVVETIMHNIDSNVMEYSSELLEDKITKNEDGGFAYRLFDLNFDVINKWVQDTPYYMLFLGDGKSITHGIFSFTFCCTGVIGFSYFVFSHIRMVLHYWHSSSICKFMSFLIFIFFFNDIVTNSRFIICVNTLLYMGMLAFMFSYNNINKQDFFK